MMNHTQKDIGDTFVTSFYWNDGNSGSNHCNCHAVQWDATGQDPSESPIYQVGQILLVSNKDGVFNSHN